MKHGNWCNKRRTCDAGWISRSKKFQNSEAPPTRVKTRVAAAQGRACGTRWTSWQRWFVSRATLLTRCAYMYMYICTYMQMCMYTYVQMYIYANVHVYIYTYIHLYMYIYTLIHLNTYTNMHIYMNNMYVHSVGSCRAQLC